MCAWPVLLATPSGLTVVVIFSLLNAGLWRARFGAVSALLVSVFLLVYLPFIAMFYAMGHAFESSAAPHLSPDQYGFRTAGLWEAAFLLTIWIPIWIRSRFDRRRAMPPGSEARPGGFPVVPIEKKEPGLADASTQQRT